MFSELSFRKKIIFSQILLFLVFFAALFPFVEKMAARLVRDSLIESTTDIIQMIEKAPTEKAMIEKLKDQENYAFFRMSLINDQEEVIYDSHLKRNAFRPYAIGKHKEVQQALKKGVGYDISLSETFKAKFAYVAQRFTLQGKSYILRTAFPYDQIQDLTETFELGLLIYSFVILLFFNTLIWLIFSRFTNPIRKIIDAIRPYQMGQVDTLPEIKLSKKSSPNEEFQILSSTLNSLSKRIQEQIKSLTSERNEKEAVLESLGEGVIAVDSEMIVRYVNAIACKMLQVSKKLFLNRALPEEGELLKACHDLIVKCQEKNTILTESLCLDGERKTFIDIVAAPKAQGSGAILVLQDKTSRYKVLEMGKDFVANASHELRTPITIIKGFAETLHEMPDMKKEMMIDITEKITRSCVRMENLVHNLLTLADVDNIPENRFRECDLVTLMENCRHIVRSVYPDAEISIKKFQESINIAADRDLLELAFVNLLDNAAKYSEGPAKITADIKPAEDEEIRIEISDRGIGIPPEDIDQIFGRFYRVDKTHSRRLGGAGLGLSIVKTIIQNHDGTIEAASTVGEGTTFTITLPIKHHSRL